MKNAVVFRLIPCILLGALIGLTTACAEKKAQMVLTCTPPDAHVTIDGFRPETLASPHTFHFFKPGTYRLDISAPGYVPVSMMIAVEKGEILKQTIHLVKAEDAAAPPNVIAASPDTAIGPPTETPPVPDPPTDSASAHLTNDFVLTVNTEPNGAKVEARSNGNRTPVVFFAPATRTLSRNGPWYLTVSKEGYKTIKRTVIGPADSDRVNLTVTLEKNDGVNPPHVSDSVPLIQPTPPVRPLPRDNTGTLTVTTIPPTQVSVDGQPIGQTPISQYPLAPGQHKILMENRALAKRKVQTIQIRTGEHVRINQTL